MTTLFRIKLAQPMAAHVALEPVYNALNSLALLNADEQFAGLDPWVSRMAASLTAERRHCNRLVFEGLGAALTTDRDWPDFPAYLDDLDATDPTVLRDRILERVCHTPQHGRHGAALTRPDLASLLGDAQTFIAMLAHLYPDDPVDHLLQAEVHALLNDPPALRTLIVSHLREVWETGLAAEWRQVVPRLHHQVTVFRQRLAPDATMADLYRSLTGRDLPMEVQREAASMDEIIFVPSPHVRRYVTRLYSDTTARLFFGAPPNFGILMRPTPIGRAELLVRLAALADDTRLRILTLLSQHDELYAQEIMARLGLSQSSASRHLSHLRSAGYLMERRGEGANKRYSLSPAQIDATFRALTRALEEHDAQEAEPAEEDAGHPQQLRRFVGAHGRVVSWPAKEKDRLLVLDYLASRFEPERQYTEKEVNAVLLESLRCYGTDHVNVRRALYDYGFLERERDGSRYWRAPSRTAPADARR